MRPPRRPHTLRPTRRQVLLAGLCTASLGTGATADPPPLALRTVPTTAPMRQLRPGGPSGLLGTAADGGLWALSASGQAPRRLADGLDAASPVATGHGRIAARTAGGGLWVLEAAQDGARGRTTPDLRLAPHAGLLVLPFAVLAVVTNGAPGAAAADHRLARFEPDAAGHWREVARSAEAVLPDARPVQADLDGRGDGGHIVVLAGPDGTRYAHGVLGDAVEATRVLWLERHGLQVLRALGLPAPHVFEDIAPRPVALPGAPGGSGLLTVRSGPQGGQLALVTADPAQPRALRLAALGDTVGGFHRWLAPTTDGRQLVAVHTPHIGGVLHVYRQEGPHLSRRRLAADVSTHHIGARETDLAVWLEQRLWLPTQDGRQVRVLDLAQDGAERAELALPGRVVQTTALADPAAWVALLDDGRVVAADAAAGRPARR